MIDWNKMKTTKKDTRIIHEIIKRAGKLIMEQHPQFDALSANMDITAVHALGCKLKLAELLAADNFNLPHDVCGIIRHIDRETGKLLDCFWPRFAA